MYAKDKTTITLGNIQEMVDVTCGIQQGCSISTLLFKMVSFCIIEDLKNQGVIYELGKYKGNSLWLANDTTLVANNNENMKTNIAILRSSARKYGLEINEGKSKIIQVRGRQKPREICNFEVVKDVKYLGIKF